MTVTQPQSGREPSVDDVRVVADSFVELARAFTRMRAQFLAAAAHDVEWSAHVILKSVAQEGPLRAGTLADLVHSDPSTVSRQVAALVKDGFIERLADPEDGRASLLLVTPKAARVLADHDAVRCDHFRRMLADWDEDDLRRFADLFQRFTRDFVDTKPDWQLSERAEPRRASAEGKN